MKNYAFLLILFSSSAFAANPIIIDTVRVEGVPLDQVEQIKTASGFLPGDTLEKNRLDRAMSKLKDFYENKGYPQVNVEQEMIKERRIIKEGEAKEVNVLDFKISLGEPIRIVEVGFSAKEGVLAPSVLAKLKLVVDLKIGEVFDRDRIKDMRRSIESALMGLNFVDSKVAEITSENSKLTLLGPFKSGLKVNFSIELGQQVVFSVYGNSFFTRSELMLMIVEQQNLGLGRDYINVLLNRFRERYLEHGFRNVKITPYTFEPENHQPRKVVYEINEGEMTQIKNIIFDGNDFFSSKDLENIFFKNAASRIVARIYNEKMVDDAARSTVEEMKKRGYLSAKLIAIKLDDIKKSANVNVRVYLNEGSLTKIQTIDFHGNHAIASEKLVEYLGLREGESLNLVQLEDGLERMKREFRNLGYLDIKVLSEKTNQLVTYSEKNQFAYLNFDLDEGARYHFSGFDLFGNEKTRSTVVEREFQLLPGAPLFENKILETEEHLRRLGIFSQENLELIDDPKENLGKRAKVSLQEAVPGNAGLGAGFRNDLGVRLFTEFSYANLWGLNHTWAFNLSGNRRINGYRFNEFSAEVSYIWPWVFLGETTFRPSLTAEKRQYLPFDAETTALSASLERSLYKPFHLSGSLTYTLEQIREFNAQVATQNQQVLVGSVTPLLRLDFRDNALSPKRGFFALTSFEYANSFLGSQSEPFPVSYGRLQLRTDYYFDFIPNFVWYLSVRGGWLKNFANTLKSDGSVDKNVTVPLIKQFALGGVNSLRGYVEQEINVQSGDADKRVQGYSTYANYRTQLDFFPSPNLSFGPFLDAGNLREDSFSFGALRYGAGLGMHYLTPVGPVNFDWGFKLFPRPGEETNVFYFSLGVI